MSKQTRKHRSLMRATSSSSRLDMTPVRSPPKAALAGPISHAERMRNAVALVSSFAKTVMPKRPKVYTNWSEPLHPKY